MKLSRDELKAKMMAEFELAVDRLLDWNDQTRAPTLTEIEDAVLKMRKQMGEQAANAIIANQDAALAGQTPACSTCGRAMRHKGYRQNDVESQAGRLKTRRAYFYCPHCQTGSFPPR